MSDAAQSSPNWQVAPAGLTLSAEQVDVWRQSTNASADALAEFAAVLSEDERGKAERLRDPAKRVESIVARGLLRRVLAMMLRRDPRELRFALGPQGKPYLTGGAGASRVRFNVSHTSGWVLVAITEEREVGIDVERVRAEFAWHPVARQFFPADEVAALLALPDEAARVKFFESWVKKEALLKAAGVGMAAGVDAKGVGGTVVELDVGAGFVAAVAVERGKVMIRRWRG